MSEEKRKRSPNWHPCEKILLLDLVEQHLAVVENKKTDGVSIRTKLAEWQKMSIAYNSQTSYYFRTAEVLKAQWESMKKAAKKEESNNRLIMNTGGAASSLKKENPINSRIMQLVETAAPVLLDSIDNDDSIPPIRIITTVAAEGPEDPLQLPHDSADIRIDNKPIHLEDVFTEDKLPDPIKENDIEMQDCEMEDKDFDDYTPHLLCIPHSTASRLSDVDDDNRKIKNRGWETSKVKSRIAKRRSKTATLSLEQLRLIKIKGLQLKYNMTREERDRAIETHKLDVAIKKETLKQAKIKTELLLLEAKLKKNQLKRRISELVDYDLC